MHASRWQRFELIFAAVAASPVFRAAIAARLMAKPLTEAEITALIEEPGYAAKSTARRRAKTVVSWLEWLWREYANLTATRTA